MSSRTKPKKSAAPLAKKPLPRHTSGIAPKPAKGDAKLAEVAVPKAAKRPSEVGKSAKTKSKRSSAGTLAAATEETTRKHPKLRAKDAAVAKKPAKAPKAAAKAASKEPARAKSGAAKPAKKAEAKSAASVVAKRAGREATRPQPRKGRPEALASAADSELDPSDTHPSDPELEAHASAGADVDAPTLLSDISEIRGARAADIAADLGLDSTTIDEEVEHEEASAVAPPASRGHLKSVIESLVFVADQAITPVSLGRLVKAKQADVRVLLEEIRADYEGRGIELIEVGGGFQFRSAAASAPFVRDLVAARPVRLTRAQLETLALIAYRQPITRPEIDDVRGVDGGSAIKVLLDRDLVKILGRKDEAGRPLLYGTGPQFLEFFGMKSLQDLPTLREFTELNEENRELFQRKMGEIPDLSDPAFNPAVVHSETGLDEDVQPAPSTETRDGWSDDVTQPVEERDGDSEALDRAPNDETEPDAPDTSDIETEREGLEGEALDPVRDEDEDDEGDEGDDDEPEADAALDEDVQGDASDDDLDSEDEGEPDDALEDSDAHDEDEDEDSERELEADDDPQASHESDKDEPDEDESDVDASDDDDDDDDESEDDQADDETEDDQDEDDEDEDGDEDEEQ